MSRVKTEVQTIGTVSYDYDAAGRMTKLTWPDAFYVNYDYDVSGAVTKIRENGATSGVGVLATYEYDDLGRRTKLTRGNGIVTDYGFDGASRLTDMDHDLPGTTHDVNVDFSYNPAGQITQRVGSNDLYAYLDHWNIDTTAIVNGLNQATSVDGNTVSYDSKGNVTSFDGNTYAYDAENFLTSGNGATVSYDAAGRLHKVVKSGTPTRKALWAGDRMIGLYDENDALVNRWMHGAGVDELLARKSGGGLRRFLVPDERGSNTLVTDDAGAVVKLNTYDSYGRNGAANGGRFGYTGQMWWGQLELYYYKARWYSPELGRFMQTDPVGYGDGMNMYGYVQGDPINNIDPRGMDTIVVVGKRRNYCGPGSTCFSRIMARFADPGTVTIYAHGGGGSSGSNSANSSTANANDGEPSNCNSNGNENSNVRWRPPPAWAPRYGPPTTRTLPRGAIINRYHPAAPRLRDLGVTRPYHQWGTRGPGDGFEFTGGPRGSWHNPGTRTSLRYDRPHGNIPEHYDLTIGKGSKAQHWRVFRDGRFQVKNRRGIEYIAPPIAGGGEGQCSA